ncbi:32967_t:CDS:1, partial [Racocetra persica]
GSLFINNIEIITINDDSDKEYNLESNNSNEANLELTIQMKAISIQMKIE